MKKQLIIPGAVHVKVRMVKEADRGVFLPVLLFGCLFRGLVTQGLEAGRGLIFPVQNGDASWGRTRDTTPLLPWRPAILSPGWILRRWAIYTRTTWFTPGPTISPI